MGNWMLCIGNTHDKKTYICAYCGERVISKGSYDEYTYGFDEVEHNCEGCDKEQELFNQCQALKKELYATERKLGEHRKSRQYVMKYDKVFKIDKSVKIKTQ